VNFICKHFKALLSFVPLVCVSSNCTSNKYKPQEIDTSMELKGAAGAANVGLNKEGEAVVQNQQAASVELMSLQHVNENLRMDLNSSLYNLKQCRSELQLPRNGGSGEAPELTDFQNLSALEKSVDKVGIENGEIKVVKTEFLVEKLDAEQKHQKEIRALLKTVKNQEDKCKFNLTAAKEKQALQNERQNTDVND
jgi:hypothetical protein